MNEWLNEWMNEWMNKWMNEWLEFPRRMRSISRKEWKSVPVHGHGLQFLSLSYASQFIVSLWLCAEGFVLFLHQRFGDVCSAIRRPQLLDQQRHFRYHDLSPISRPTQHRPHEARSKCSPISKVGNYVRTCVVRQIGDYFDIELCVVLYNTVYTVPLSDNYCDYNTQS